MTSGSAICSDSSAKRPSICSTSFSITRLRVAALRHDFHADHVLLGGGPRVLHREHRLQRRDGDRELRQVGLPRGETLELDAGPHQDARPALGAVLAEPLDELKASPATSGMPATREMK